MGGIEIDGHEVKQLEVDLSGASLRVQFNAGKATRAAARVIDREMTIDATGHMGNWFGRPGTSYPTPLEQHVTHEMLAPLLAEIGIEKQGAGKLAHIIAYGSVNNAPAYDPGLAPRRAMGEVLDIYADAAEESVLGDGEGGRKL